MNFKSLSDDTLHERTRTAASQEKQATLALLELLAEIDERRLYNARGYSSLWEYLHMALSYSEAQASERVSAMRLMRRVPEVRAKLVDQSISLTTTSKLAAFVRREKCDDEKTHALLQKVAGKPTREVERLLVSEQTVPVSKPDLIRPSGPETTRVSFDADSEFFELYEELRNLQGRPDFSMCNRLKSAMRKVIRKRNPRRPERASTRPAAGTVIPNPLRAPEVRVVAPGNANCSIKSPEALRRARKSANSSSRYIPIPTRTAIRNRSGGRCEFIDPMTNRRCESRFDLEFDHIHPFALGGKTSLENLRQLCASHNHFEAIRVFGAQKISGNRPYSRGTEARISPARRPGSGREWTGVGRSETRPLFPKNTPDGVGSFLK